MAAIGIEMTTENKTVELEINPPTNITANEEEQKFTVNQNQVETPNPATNTQPEAEKNNIPSAIPSAVPSNIYEAVQKMNKLGFVPLYGSSYKKFETAGSFTRGKTRIYERYGIFNADNGQYTRVSSPLLYIVKVNDREYKETQFSHCWCCCCDPVKIVDPPTWKIIDAQTNEIIMTVKREVDDATQFISTIPSEPPIIIHTDRPSNFCRGDCRNCGCDCCCPVSIRDIEFKKEIGGDTFIRRYKSLYGIVHIYRDEKEIFNNTFVNDCSCCTKITCCNSNTCCNCCEEEGDKEPPLYIPTAKWTDPHSCLCCHCDNCCTKGCCGIPIVEQTGFNDRKDVTITRTAITPLNQTDDGFVGNAEIIEYGENNNIPFEEKIAVILGNIIPHVDDPYDKDKISCYMCSKPC